MVSEYSLLSNMMPCVSSLTKRLPRISASISRHTPSLKLDLASQLKPKPFWMAFDQGCRPHLPKHLQHEPGLRLFGVAHVENGRSSQRVQDSCATFHAWPAVALSALRCTRAAQRDTRKPSVLLGLSAGRPIRVIYKFEYFPRSFKYCCNSFPASGGADGLPNEPANSLRSRRLVWLLQAPSVDCTQERVGYSHLIQPALDTTRWTSHKKLLTSRVDVTTFIAS